MSKLINAIAVKQTMNPRRAVDLEPIACASIHSSADKPTNQYHERTEVKLSVELGYSTYCYSNGSDLNDALYRVRRMVAENVFGEFRMPLVQLEEALFRRDYKAATDKLREITHLMFGEAEK